MKKLPTAVDLDRAALSNDPGPLGREWLVTNGIGGYASGTVGGALTRRYHGLLVAASRPPLGRTLLFARVDDTVVVDGDMISLSANRWVGDSVAGPQGHPAIARFRLEGTTPVWTYEAGAVRLEKRIWMAREENRSFVRYDHMAGPAATLGLKALVDHRDHHAVRPDPGPDMEVAPVLAGVMVTAFPGVVPLVLECATASVAMHHEWYRDYRLDVEAFRGLDHVDSHLHAATFTAELAPGGSVTLVASAGAADRADPDAELSKRHRYEADLLAAAGSGAEPDWIRHLVLAADQFIVDRTVAGAAGKSVIAGYHWFGDWGRDTMIALPGLTLATGRAADAASILRTFARFVDRGMLPNRFPDDGAEPEYNTVDATLWYFEAVRSYLETTGDEALARDLFPVLAGIVEWHERGTRYGIGVDPADGLLAAGEPGVQLTWMDAKVGDWVVTPRIGKPVEINALWYNALGVMAELATIVGADPAPFRQKATGVAAAFDRFWNEETGCCFDVIDGPDGDDPAIRPNQIIAVGLEHSPLSVARRAAVVDVCRRHLLTPLGLRTLAPGDGAYIGTYGGGVTERDGSYHQGTVWPWLIGPYVAALLKVGEAGASARTVLDGIAAHLGEFGVGSIAEIAEGDAPHAPRGAIAQAWSVAAVLAAWRATTPGATRP